MYKFATKRRMYVFNFSFEVSIRVKDISYSYIIHKRASFTNTPTHTSDSIN